MITSDESCLCCDTFLQNCYIFLYFEMLLVCHGDVSKLNASLPHIYQPSCRHYYQNIRIRLRKCDCGQWRHLNFNNCFQILLKRQKRICDNDKNTTYREQYINSRSPDIQHKNTSKRVKKMYISKLMRMTCLWNNLHHIRYA